MLGEEKKVQKWLAYNVSGSVMFCQISENAQAKEEKMFVDK